ncbi:RECQ-MEDIATED GENOME INSTABILITY PROTEIN 1 RMI1 [Salix purpurea]|uniref:RecQ-mediated genome instability protein 1 n=1 Tax=Salix purpurea TaxID=77065 RepID=A0A9Q0W870_SALPP|nr:RECQ-MEDIATED GENOME INSTABILITY PROTEIN 1 RMI1 [Salix purpurea]
MLISRTPPMTSLQCLLLRWTHPISGCPTGDFLLRTGLSLKREWLDSSLRQIDNSFDIASKAKLCFAQFLISDMNQCGAGVLPPNVDSMHLADLPGPFVLQVDEIVNISCPLKGRYQDANVGVKRCLKLCMTDGVQRVYGMEYRPIKDLKVLAPAGFKVAICNVHIRHGLLMLVPEALEVLGGVVEELEAARQRLADEISKPPRGRRSRTGEVPPLATRATQAAWAPNGVNIPNGTNNSGNVPGHTNTSANDLQNNNGSGNALRRTNSSVNVVRHTDRSISQVATSFQEDGRGANLVASGTVTSQRIVEECAVPMSAETTMSNLPSSIVSDVGEMHINAPSISGASSVSNQHSNGTLEQEDVRMTVEFEHPLILSRDREIPFTYLASLSAKWAAMKEKEPSVRGKIKCFLTGVKGFQYKQRKTYELQVYVDDGSLISEILIDHNVVLKGIGCSPVEVTAALSSSDTKRVGEMKETLRQFQMFLVNFEGTMLVEINGASKLPVALEMNQGCPSSDAWLLMRRLKSFSSALTSQHSSMAPIDISP